MKPSFNKIHGILFFVVLAISMSCHKESVVSSSGSVNLGSSSYELKNAYYSNNWGSLSYLGGELILAGPTIYFDSPSGFFNSNGKSAFIIIINSELSQLKSGDYDLVPNQTLIHIDADPKATDSVGMKNAFQPVGDVIEGKMTIREGKESTLITITGACYVNKIRTDLNVSFTGRVGKIPEPYHVKN